VRVALICLNYPPEPTGIAVYSGGLVDGLAARGIDVRVVTGLPHYPQWRVLEGFEPGETTEPEAAERGSVAVARRWHPVPVKPRLLNRLLMELVFGFNAVRAPWGRPDVVVMISPALFSSVLASLRALLQRRPLVIWVQDIYSLGVSETGHAGTGAGRLLGTVERWLLRRADAVVTIHERFKAFAVRELSIDRDRVAVIRNWSHVELSTDSDRMAIRSRLGWPETTTVVLHAGNMGAKQGLENVVAASRLAADQGEDLLFVLMGDGNQRAQLESAGGNACLRIIDPVPSEDFLGALQSADVLLVNERAGLTEMAVPSKLTSYFATGRPVIAATDAASVTAEEVSLSGGGIRVDADDPALLVGAALKLRADPAWAAELGKNGQAFRESTLTASASLDAFDRLLTTVSTRSSVPDRIEGGS
jgi:colanic acid biosynthesis glycosyl transferase WcaI